MCNFGKLNYYLGKRAFLEGRESRYPDIDFCKDPEIICTSDEHKELKWIAGFFYWVDQVQPYDQGGWNYLSELKKFVNEGMTGDAFINSVSGIVNRGCHNPPCGTGDLDGGPERAENFFRILDALEFSFVDVIVSATAPPAETAAPTPLPTPMPIVGTASPVASTITYNCGGGGQQLENYLSGVSPPSIDLVFDYELHSDLDVAVNQALQEIKSAILSDIAERLGCTEASRRRLQGTSGNVVGLMASRSDMPDPDAAGCQVEVDSLEPTACTPVKGEIKVFSEEGSSEADIQNMSEYLLNTIKESMDSGHYESSVVRRVTFIGNRKLYSEGLNPPLPVAIQTEPEDGPDWMKIAMYSLAGLCAFLLCLLCMIIPSTRRKSPTHDEERAMLEYMNAHRESYYKGRSSTEPQSPQNAIQRRSEHLRAVQQGRPLQAPYALESGTATSESDDDDDSYFRRRHSVNRNSRNRNHTSPHEIVVMQEPPIERRGSARQIIPAGPPQPPMIIGETGHFCAPSGEIEQEEREETLQAIEYQPQRGGGIDSLPGNESSSEEEEHPVQPSRRRHTNRGAIQGSHDPQLNAERRQRKNRETWAAPRSGANEMSKEERQRRIERARSNRRSLG